MSDIRFNDLLTLMKSLPTIYSEGDDPSSEWPVQPETAQKVHNCVQELELQERKDFLDFRRNSHER